MDRFAAIVVLGAVVLMPASLAIRSGPLPQAASLFLTTRDKNRGFGGVPSRRLGAKVAICKPLQTFRFRDSESRPIPSDARGPRTIPAIRNTPPASTPARLKVIYPNFKLLQTGVSSTVFALSARLVAMGVDVSIIGKQPPGQRIRRPVESDGSVPPVLVWHARRNIEMLAGLILKRFRPETKVIFTSAAQRVHTAYTKYLISKVDVVISTSAASASFIDRQSVIVPHGVDTARFSPVDRALTKRQLGLDPDSFYLGSFGALRAGKGTDLFVDALIATMAQRPAWKAIVVGHVAPAERAYVDELRGRIASAGLANRVKVLGHLPDASDYLRAMDICVAPSRKEGFGLTALEAMSSGVPVVASQAGSYTETIIHGETGLICETGNVTALEGALASLMDDDTWRQQLGRQGRERVLTHYGIEREAEALLNIYTSLVE